MAKQETSTIIIIHILALSIVQGCYIPFDVPIRRPDSSLGVIGDSIIFAGGGTPIVSSDQVDIYDARAQEVSKFILPVGRRTISVAGSGSIILFAGGVSSAGHYPFIDVLNLDTLNITTIALPTNRAIFQSVVVGMEAFFYDNYNLFSFDMETFNITQIPITGVIESAATDGSVIYFLSNSERRIDRFDPKNASWSIFRTLDDTGFTNLFYNNRRSVLIAYRSGRIINMPVNDSRTVDYNVAEDMRVSTDVPVISGDFIYAPNRRSMVVHDVNNRVSFRLRMTHATYDSNPSAVVHDGIIYYTGSGSHAIPVLTVNTRAIIQLLPISVGQTYPPFAAGDLLFWFQQSTASLTTYNWVLQETNNFEWTRPRSLFLSASLPVANKLLVVSVTSYDTFNFDTQELVSRDFPSDAQLDLFWSHSAGDYAVFLSRRSTTVNLYDGYLDTWTQVNTTRPCNRAVVIDAKVAFSCGLLLEVYDIKVHQWLPSLTFGEDRLGNTQLLPIGSLVFFAGGPTGNSTTRVYRYNSTSHKLDYFTLFEARTQLQIASANNEWVVFFGGVTDNVVSARVDLHNIYQGTWTPINLPPTSTNIGTMRITNSGNFLAFGRGTRIDILDLTNFAVVAAPHECGGVAILLSLGSKIICSGHLGRLFDITIYETSTQMVQTIEMIGSLQFDGLKAWRNILHFSFGTTTYMIPLSATFSSIQTHEIYSGFPTNFTLDALGFDLSFNWHHNRVPLNATGSTLDIPNAQRESEGMYEVHISDQCSERMTQQAQLIVNGPPQITLPLQNTVLLCHEAQNISTQYQGKEVSLDWTISDVIHVTSGVPYLTVASDTLECNSDNAVCVTASNPAGSVSSCATVRFVEVDQVFQGPLPTSDSDMHFIGSKQDLQVSIKEDWCTYHTWFADGQELMTFEDRDSKYTVEVTRGMERTQFYVVAQCGNNQVRSEPFVFDNIAPLELWHFVLILVLCPIALVGVVVLAILGVRRLRQSAEHEVELQNMLSQAKTESLQKDATPLIQATKWEWKPTEDFTYKSLNSLPFCVDTSLLQFDNSHDPLEVDMVAQSDIIFSLNGKKAKKQLKQPLLDDMRVDIYVPISPKYEIIVEPSSFELSSNSSVHVAVSVKLRMTTRCKITLVVVLEQQNIYSAIEFKLSSKMSTWIDLEEIEMNGEFLGGGGFGSVVRGVYRGQDVAVKKLLSQYLTDEMKIEFEREVTLMKSLRHTNIVQFIGASNVKESLAIVIEYAPLGSLASVMEKQSLSVQFKVMCLLETAKALHFLHSNGVIHRDIKPQNILVFSLETRAAVHVKLTDFGTSRFIADDPTTITKNVGTIAYMAPEALGRNPRIDKSADVYSFAVLMWSVLFEQVPFKEFKWDSDIEQHVKSGNRLPFPHGHGIDPLLVKLIEECWQHETTARPSMSEVVKRLSSLQM